MKDQDTLSDALFETITDLISETNGVSIHDTLSLLLTSRKVQSHPEIFPLVQQFQSALAKFQIDQSDIETLLEHPFSKALYRFFQDFPLPYREEHIHLTGSLSPDFVFPLLMESLEGPAGPAIRQKITQVYGAESLPIETEADVAKLVRLKDEEQFDRYLQILMLPKLILTDRASHRKAAYHMASTLFHKYNVGHLRLKFTLSRATSGAETVPGLGSLTPEDVALGLYSGFMDFKAEQPQFQFVLSPCFRKEPDFFDASRFASKKDDVTDQINTILLLLERFPELRPYLSEVDTVGNERNFFRKAHFKDMAIGFRKLQYSGFQIRSHHGETWNTLRCGIQAVDNAMNIWHIDALEHGLSLGVNPNYYFHSLHQRVSGRNADGAPVIAGSQEHHELLDMQWNDHGYVRDKLIQGVPLSEAERKLFTKAKFHTATEVEHYQHDVLNRLIQKGVALVSLPSSNYKLTACFDDFKDHPFSWWEKKGLQLGVGTDNYVTLGTDFIREMLILLFMDPLGLKITKLLMITTGETRRPYISSLLWKMHS